MGGSVCYSSVCGGFVSTDKQSQLALTKSSERFLQDPEKLRLLVKTQAMVKGHLVRELVKR